MCPYYGTNVCKSVVKHSLSDAMQARTIISHDDSLDLTSRRRPSSFEEAMGT